MRYIAVTLRASRDDETGQYTAVCDELGVPSCGDTLDQAFENVTEATLLYLDSIEAAGERERIFKERGIAIVYGDDPEAPRSIQVSPNEYIHPSRLPIAA
jgi:predicted RNase H-like HicB family nuclease